MFQPPQDLHGWNLFAEKQEKMILIGVATIIVPKIEPMPPTPCIPLVFTPVWLSVGLYTEVAT